MNFKEVAADLLKGKLIESHELCCQETLNVGNKQCETQGSAIEKRGHTRRKQMHNENFDG